MFRSENYIIIFVSEHTLKKLSIYKFEFNIKKCMTSLLGNSKLLAISEMYIRSGKNTVEYDM